MKKTVNFYNLLIAVACAVAIIFYLTSPFISIHLKTKVTGSMLNEFIGESAGIDLSDMDDANIDVTLSVETKTMFSILSSKDRTSIVREDVINKNIDLIINQLEPTLNSIIESTAKSVVKTEVKNSLQNELAATLGQDKDSSDVLACLNDEQIDTAIDSIFDSLTADGATLDSVVDTIVDNVNNIIDDLKSDPKLETISNLSESDIADIKDNISKTFEEYDLVNEDGTLKDLSNIAASLISSMLSSTDTNDSKSDIYLCADEEATEEDLASVLKEKINSSLTEEAVQVISKVFVVCAIVLITIIVLWAILLITALLKSVSKKPNCKILYIVILGWLFELVAIIVNVFAKNISIMGDSETLAQVWSSASIHVTTSGLAATIIVACLVVFKILFYTGAVKKLEKVLKKENQEAENK